MFLKKILKTIQINLNSVNISEVPKIQPEYLPFPPKLFICLFVPPKLYKFIDLPELS